MEKLNQYALNKRYAEDTGNRVDPSTESFRTGIEFKSEARSNILNGSFYLLSQAIQYLQFTGGLYDNNASYNEGNIVSCVVKDIDKYRLWRFRRNSNNASTLTGNAPITGGSIETVNGVDVYVLGTVSRDWDKLEDFNYSSQAIPNFIISRDNEGSAKIEMPSVVDDKSIINKSYLKAINVSYEDTKELEATNLQDAVDNVLLGLETASNQINSIITSIGNLQKRLPIPSYYIQFPGLEGGFYEHEEPTNWYKNLYEINTTWQLRFNTESLFFRTEGSLANSGRSYGLQGDAGRNATGSFWSPRSMEYFATGVFYASSRKTSTSVVDVETDVNRLVNIDLSRAYTTTNEFRSTNRLIRVFRLTHINGVKVTDIIGR